jgi:predicted MPP superfamily phosphohydrolase
MSPEWGTDEDAPAETEADLGPLVARLSRPLSPTRTRIAVVADPHLTPTASGTWKAYHRTETRLRTAVDVVNDVDPDATLFLGDLTRDGRPEEFACVDDVLAGLDGEWVAVPGNHDVPKMWDDYETPAVSEFADRYAAGSLPFHVQVGGVDLVGLDSASGDGDLYESHEGFLPESHLEWLDETLSTTRTPLVALHHNVFHPREHTGQFAEGDFYQLRNADEVAATLSQHDVPLVLSGHIHWPATARRRGVRELIAPATCSFPQAMLVVDIGPFGTDVRMVPLAGPKGTAESYMLVRDGNAHGQSIAAHAERGALTDLPMVDERRTERRDETERGVGADVPGTVRWR